MTDETVQPEAEEVTPLEEAIEEATDNVEVEGQPEATVEDIPTVKLGMVEVTEIVDFGIAFGKAVENSLEDEKLTISDLPNFMGSFMKLIPAVSGLSEAKLELMAATTEDVDNLKAHIKENLDLEDDQLEGLIQASIAIVLDTWHLVNTFFIKKD